MDILDKFLSLGSPTELIAAGESISLDTLIFRYNSHIHLPPNFSAFYRLDQIIKQAREEKINVLGCSNYYDYSVYEKFAELCLENNIVPLFGLEVICFHDDLYRSGVRLNDPDNPGRMYICGKGAVRLLEDKLPKETERLLNIIRRRDSARIRKMIEKLNSAFREAGLDIDLDEDRIRRLIAEKTASPEGTIYLQERHLAMAYQEKLYRILSSDRDRLYRVLNFFGKIDPAEILFADVVQGFIRSTLMKAGKSCYVEEEFISFEDAKVLIEGLDGLICYPVLADGADPISEFEWPVEGIIDRLKKEGIHCVEFIPTRNKLDVLREYIHSFDDAGFIVLAGTEHNTQMNLSLIPSSKEGKMLPADIDSILRKGVCYMVGLQYVKMLCLKGALSSESYSRSELTMLGAGLIKKICFS